MQRAFRYPWMVVVGAALAWGAFVAKADPARYTPIAEALARGCCADAEILLIENGDSLSEAELESVARAAAAQERRCRWIGRLAASASVALTGASFLLPHPWITPAIALTNAVGINVYLIYGFRRLSAKGCAHRVAMARDRQRPLD